MQRAELTALQSRAATVIAEESLDSGSGSSSVQARAHLNPSSFAVDVLHGPVRVLSQRLEAWCVAATSAVLAHKERCLASLHRKHQLSLAQAALTLEEFERSKVERVEVALSQVRLRSVIAQCMLQHRPVPLLKFAHFCSCLIMSLETTRALA